MLREAGVVDAGGYGVTIIFAGVVAALRGTDAPELEHHAAPAARDASAARVVDLPLLHELRGHRPRPRGAQTFIEPLEQIGDSVLVVGDAATLKVHVHTDEPEQATAVFDGAGRGLAARRRRHARAGRGAQRAAVGATATRRRRLPSDCCGALAVVRGRRAWRRCSRASGFTRSTAAPTLNPSTYELLAGIHEVPAEEVVVLPNSPNVFMAAERAAELSDKQVCVVPTRNQQAGLAAAIALLPDGGAAGHARPRCATRSSTCGPAASRPPRARIRGGRFAVGDAVGYVGDDLVAWGEPEATLRDVLARLADGAELVTCIAGDGAPLDAATIDGAGPDGVEIEYSAGGQPSWWWLLSAE